MIEAVLMLLICLTQFVDSIALSIRANAQRNSAALSYAASGAVLYMSRGAVLLIMPIIGMIADGFIKINILLFCALLMTTSVLLHLAVFCARLRLSVLCRAAAKDYQLSLKRFFQSILSIPLRLHSFFWRRSKINWWSVTVYSVYGAIFPAVLIVVGLISEFKATAVSAYGVATGIFSLIFVFSIEREIARKNARSSVHARKYLDSVLAGKAVGTVISALVISILYVFAAR